MPFVYRLQKILDFRIRKKEEQLLAVQRAQKEVNIAQQNIDLNNQEIESTKKFLKESNPRMLETFDTYLHHLWGKARKLEEIKQEKIRLLQEEIEKLVELEKAVKVLEKHKEKNKEAYLEEEKKAELKMLSEIGVQRHFQHSQQKIEEEKILKQLSENEIKLMEGEL